MSVAVYGERWRDTCQRRAEQTDELGYAGSLEDGEPTLDGLDACGLQNMEFCPKFFSRCLRAEGLQQLCVLPHSQFASLLLGSENKDLSPEIDFGLDVSNCKDPRLAVTDAILSCVWPRATISFLYAAIDRVP